jgi:hypothetical protein
MSDFYALTIGAGIVAATTAHELNSHARRADGRHPARKYGD